jgi:hypothetical protein
VSSPAGTSTRGFPDRPSPARKTVVLMEFDTSASGIWPILICMAELEQQAATNAAEQIRLLGGTISCQVKAITAQFDQKPVRRAMDTHKDIQLGLVATKDTAPMRYNMFDREAAPFDK